MTVVMIQQMMMDATATMNNVNGKNTQLYWHESTVTTAIALVMTETMVMMNEGNRGQCANGEGKLTRNS